MLDWWKTNSVAPAGRSQPYIEQQARQKKVKATEPSGSWIGGADLTNKLNGKWDLAGIFKQMRMDLLPADWQTSMKDPKNWDWSKPETINPFLNNDFNNKISQDFLKGTNYYPVDLGA